MKIKNLIVIGAAAFLMGCSAPVSTQIFNSENLVAQGAVGATHAFNVYYASQTNPPASLIAARTQIYEADTNLSQALAITETLREEYATNSSSTNLASVNFALEAAQLELTNIVNLAQSIITETR